MTSRPVTGREEAERLAREIMGRWRCVVPKPSHEHDDAGCGSCVLEQRIADAIQASYAEGQEWERRFQIACPWCGEALRGKPVSYQMAHLVHCGDKQRVAGYAEGQKARDQEWWDALAGVPGVGPSPQAVKRWVMAEREQAKKDALEDAKRLAVAAMDREVQRNGVTYAADRLAELLEEIRASLEPPQEGASQDKERGAK